MRVVRLLEGLTVELLIAVAVVAAAGGATLGVSFGVRHLERECEKAYLTGHVDGYEKAVRDGGV